MQNEITSGTSLKTEGTDGGTVYQYTFTILTDKSEVQIADLEWLTTPSSSSAGFMRHAPRGQSHEEPSNSFFPLFFHSFFPFY